MSYDNTTDIIYNEVFFRILSEIGKITAEQFTSYYDGAYKEANEMIEDAVREAEANTILSLGANYYLSKLNDTIGSRLDTIIKTLEFIAMNKKTLKVAIQNERVVDGDALLKTFEKSNRTKKKQK